MNNEMIMKLDKVDRAAMKIQSLSDLLSAALRYDMASAINLESYSELLAENTRILNTEIEILMDDEKIEVEVR